MHHDVFAWEELKFFFDFVNAAIMRKTVRYDQSTWLTDAQSLKYIEFYRSILLIIALKKGEKTENPLKNEKNHTKNQKKCEKSR